ncbi:regulator of G signaling [Fusarium pseudoanthophilum]|uniref:Regulator of G signaling n=1 Tax=Fusarium pseudoanthophilum TaxID=48495 RepID=A0A8H5NK88_9HYPO|nr:regulator of G signaling [Fusarium pseudoanthophilum]
MMGVSRSRRQSLECHGCNIPPPSPQPSSAFEDIFDVDSPVSRPVSEAFMSGASTPNGTIGSRPPSLTEILLDVASPPWTLSAFMAYLSQNHCMESLEFTLDSQRYAAFYNEMITNNPNRTQETNDRVCILWEKLMQVYIIPCAPREVNLPARIRDQLLGLPCGPTPPHPAQLDEAGRILYELMNDSLLLPFLQSVAPMQLDGPVDEHGRGSRRSSNSNTRMGAPVRSMNSMHHTDPESLTDDSDCNSTPGMEPMTPPTTPPTSEWAFTTSPGGLQRAVAAHNKAYWTHELSQEALEAEGSYHGHPLHSNSTAADDGWYHNPELQQDGGFGDGTAAKSDTARSGAKASLVQRNIRMRRRQNKPPALVTNMQLVGNKYTPQSHQASATPSYRPALLPPPVSSDYAGNNNIDSTSMPMTDVSNYLPTPTTSNEDMRCPSTSSETEAFRYASPIEDMYGWDAELERREASPSRDSISSTEGLDAFALSYRRANGSKHSLLQRVFRVGSSSSVGKMETAA